MAMSSSSEIGKLSLKDETTWTIAWTIENFFSYTEKDGKYTSPCFSVPGSRWYLNIFPNGSTKDASVGYISFYVFKAFPKRPITANFTLGLQRADGTVKEVLINGSGREFFTGKGRGLHKFLQRSELFQKKSELAPSNALTLICRLQIKDKLDSISRLVELSESFEELFITEKFCDVTLNVQHEKFPVHKCVLASRSTVFEVMFDADMKEKRTGIVDIQDCDSGAFKDFLTFLYSGQCEVCPENVFNLYRIAHKYDVEELQCDCVVFIVNNLSFKNLYDAVIFGDEMDNEEVNNKTQDFFVKNFTGIIFTSEWESFSKRNWRLADKLLKSLAEDMKSKEYWPWNFVDNSVYSCD